MAKQVGLSARGFARGVRAARGPAAVVRPSPQRAVTAALLVSAGGASVRAEDLFGRESPPSRSAGREYVEISCTPAEL